jgi:hypothetical protein
MIWGVEFRGFCFNIAAEIGKPQHDGLRHMINTLSHIVLSEDPHPTVQYIATFFQLVNRMSQDVTKDILANPPDGEVLVGINASAGVLTDLEAGGGGFGDPFYSCTTQEESRFRSMSFVAQLFVQFVLCRYVEAELVKERVARFAYLEDYAPRDGTSFTLQLDCEHYSFAAANDNTKKPLTEEQQTELARKYFRNLYGYLMDHPSLVGCVIGAWGIGMFAGSVSALVKGMEAALTPQHSDSTHSLPTITMAYWINLGDKPDRLEVAKSNYNYIAKKWDCPEL